MDNKKEIKDLEIDTGTLKYFDAIRKWTMFLSIAGFIFLGLIIVIGIIAGTFLSAFSSGKLNSVFPGPLLFIPLLIAAIVDFLPILFLFRFSKHTAIAVHTRNMKELHRALKSLRAFFVYLGILLIVVLSIYAVALIMTGSSIALLKGL